MSGQPTALEGNKAVPEKIPSFSQEDADRVYNELKTLNVSLDADPLAFGPKRLNGKVAEVRKHLDRCERIFLDLAQRLHAVKRLYRIGLASLELGKKHLYANDPETRSGRSVADREAIAIGKLKEDVEKVTALDVAAQDMESVLLVVKARRSDLRDTQGRLKDQVRLCQEEIGLGNRWGSKLPGAPELHPGKVSSDLSEVADILGVVEGEIHLKEADGEEADGEEGAEEAAPTPAPDTVPALFPITAPAPAPEPAPAPKPASEPVPEPAPVPVFSSEEGEEEEGDLLLDTSLGSPQAPLNLPTTASQEDVDAFLDSGAEKVSPKGGDQTAPAKEESVLDSIVDSFEESEKP